MRKSVSEQRMVENEVVFRKYNEQVQKNFDELKRIAREDGQHHGLMDEDIPLHFRCECADENCHQRIKLKLSRFNEIHQARNRFVIIPGHEVDAIERVVSEKANYAIAEKFEIPPEDATRLQATSVNNT